MTDSVFVISTFGHWHSMTQKKTSQNVNFIDPKFFE